MLEMSTLAAAFCLLQLVLSSNGQLLENSGQNPLLA